jgi:hypothetical protein
MSETTTPVELSPAEQEYTDAVVAFLTLEQEHAALDARIKDAEGRLKDATVAMHEVFGDDKLAAVTHERDLATNVINATPSLAGTRQGEAGIRAAAEVVRIEEAVASGISREDAMMAVILGQDPRKPLDVESLLGGLGKGKPGFEF